MNQAPAYSALLQDFAMPLFEGNESSHSLIEKLKVAELVWNHCIAEEFKLPAFAIIDRAIRESNELYPEMKTVFLKMRQIKLQDSNQYKNYIVKTEYRIKQDGSGSIYVESIEPEKLMNIEYE